MHADSRLLLKIADGNVVNRKAPDATYGPMIPIRFLSWFLLACLALSPRTDASDLAADGRGGYLVVAEDTNTVRLVSPDGSISALSGISGAPVEFKDRLTAIAFDKKSRDAYVSDYDEVYRVTSLGTVSVVAGNPDSVDFRIDSPSGRIAMQSPLRDVIALSFDPLSDTLFIAEHSGRVLALSDDSLRVYAGADWSGLRSSGPTLADNTRRNSPLRDMDLAPDGSLLVIAGDHIWRIPPGGSPIHAIGQSLDGTVPGATFPGLVTLALWENVLYAGTAQGEILRIEPDGALHAVSSAKVPAGRFAFTGSGTLALLTGDDNDFAITEIGREGSFARTLSLRKRPGGPLARRIIGGTRVPANDLLAAVLVSTGSGFCTGSLISPDWVLTAVHCVRDAEGNSNGPFRVSACTDLASDCPHREISVRSVHVHPRYEHRGFIDIRRVPSDWRSLLPTELPRAWPYDISLLRLERPIEGIETLDVADFTTEQSVVAGGSQGFQIGWGNTRFSLTEQSYPDSKRWIATPVRLSDECRSFLAHGSRFRAIARLLGVGSVLDSVNDVDIPLWNHRICAGWPRPPPRLASWGDSGGPLLAQRADGSRVQLGALSSSRPRLSPSGAEFLNVYIRTASVYDWIDEITGIGGRRIPAGSVGDRARPVFGRFRDCGDCPEMVVIPTGDFEMGAASSETGFQSRESPRQRVRIGRRLAVGAYEVSFRQWYRCVDAGGCSQRPDDSLRQSDRPVVNVNYWDTIEYAAWLGRMTGRPYRLLTEAEWEYAARAGTVSPYYSGVDMTAESANFGSGGRDRGSSVVVGSYPPNQWGLHDIAGNVAEWVQDCARDTLGGQDPFGESWQMSGCARRIVRGGSWFDPKIAMRSAHRNDAPTSSRASWIGFRVARTLRDGASILPTEDDHANGPAGASLLVLGQQMAGRIEPGDDQDWFRLDLDGRTGIAIYSTGALDTVGSLRDSANREITSVNNVGGESNFRIETVLDRGTYLVRVTSVSNRTGSYVLHAERTGQEVAPERFSNSIGMEFGLVPAGEFVMGSANEEADSDERPATRVRISRAYYLGTHEVTQGQWKAVMGSNPSNFTDCGDDCPMDSVSWNDTQEFIRRLNQGDDQSAYRLPTEAEWEYAARAGTAASRYSPDVAEIAWHAGNSGLVPHPVGGKRANAFGLHDMLGNVWEWVADWYGPYKGGSVMDPTGPSSGSLRIIRGGSWHQDASLSRAAYRYETSPAVRYNDVGFRLAKTLQPSDSQPPTRDTDGGILTLGSAVSGRIYPANDRDQYQFGVEARSKVSIRASGMDRLRGELFKVAPTPVETIFSSNIAGQGQEATLNRGTYVLIVSSGNTGTYTVHTELLKDDPIVFDLNQDFDYNDKTVGTVERIVVSAHENDSSRLSVAVSATLPNFTATLDEVLGGQLPGGSCSQRTYWLGGTRILSVGSNLRIATRMRYEQWICASFLRTRIARANQTVALRLSIDPGPLNALAIKAVIEDIDIDNVPGWLEDILLRLAKVPSVYSYPFPIPWDATGSPCSLAEVMRTLSPRLESARFSKNGDDVRVVVTISIDRDLTEARKCLM